MNHDEINQALYTSPPRGHDNNNKTQTQHEKIQQQKELHIAPMLHVSTIEFRALMRILSKRCVLWTEMVVDETLVYNVDPITRTVPLHLLDPPQLTILSSSVSSLDNNNNTCGTPTPTITTMDMHPVVCQIGGIRPEWTAIATQIIQCAGYTYEINLNLDCPSNRVQGKRFGAILMKDVQTTTALIQSMQQEQLRSQTDTTTAPTNTKISVKCRIGIDECTEYEWIERFIAQLSSNGGCTRFILHARPVLLQGLSPAQNRCIPPLNYAMVYRLCHRFPQCQFIINGGITNLQSAYDIVYGTKRQQPQQPPGDDNDKIIANETGGCNGTVPCCRCNVVNGSCIAPPPYPAPTNLVGCMIGRAIMDDPIQFWDMDQFWYDDNTTTTRVLQTRRNILSKYCTVLQQLYPRRCCDDEITVLTDRLPAPKIIPTRSYCPICGDGNNDDIYSDTLSTLLSLNYDDHNASSSRQQHDDDVDPCMTKAAVLTDQTDRYNRNNRTNSTTATKLKITTRVIDRSLKPVLNLFLHQPGAKAFRRMCETLSRDNTIRNCGPAFILQCAVRATISNAVLDQPLAPNKKNCVK